ncbi:hypothetical protein GOP47_0020433, partial [Adiantum capillus-veneris]
MGKVMLDHLNQIIGKEELPSPIIREARAKIFSTTPTLVDPDRANYLERPFTLDECRRTLKKLGEEKSLGWDGITVKFCQEFWEVLGPSFLQMASRAFTEGMLESWVKKGLIKLIPKQLACSQLKRRRPVTMMTVIYNVLAKRITERMSPVLVDAISPCQHGFIKGKSIYGN